MSTYNNPKTNGIHVLLLGEGGRKKKKKKKKKKSDFTFGLLNALALSLKLLKGFLFSCGWTTKVGL
jgi:hypothetical protein